MERETRSASTIESEPDQCHVPLILKNIRNFRKTEIGRRSRTLQEERQESNYEYQEDTDDAACDPVKDRSEEVAAVRAIQQLAIGVEFADDDG